MKKTLLLCIVIFCLQHLHAQNNNCKCEEGEKLKPAIYAYADNGNLDSALILYQQIKKQNTDVCNLLYFHGTAQLYLQKQNPDSARYAIDAAGVLVKKINCVPGIVSKHYSITGLYFTRVNKLDSAAWAFLKAVEAAENSDNKYALARSYGDVATAVSKNDDLQKAIEYDKKAIAVARTINDQPGTQLLAAKLVSLASSFNTIYTNTGNKIYLDSVYQIATEAITAAKTGAEIKIILEGYNILSRYYYITKDYRQSNLYSDSIIAAHIPGFTNYAMHLAYYNKAAIAAAENNNEQAAVLADSSEKYAALFNPQAEINALKLVYENYRALNNNSRSLQAFVRMTMLKDSLFSLDKNKTVTELEKKYNQAKNEKTIKELLQQKLIYALLGLGGLLIAGLIAFYFRQQSLKHKQKILETEQRLNRARMNPHFFFNALTAMQRFAMKENDGKALASNLSKFSHIMRQTLESSYEEYVTIKQEIEFLKEYMEIQKMRYPEKFSYTIMVDGEIDPADIFIPSMIVQPFIENSIEHGFAGIDYTGNISIHFYKRQQEVLISIKDNGQGLSAGIKENDGHISRASQIVKDRIYLLNIKLKTKAKFNIDNAENESGVIVKIHLPVIYRNANTAN